MHFPCRQEKAGSAISILLKTFAQTENNSQGEEANEEIHMPVTGISLHMVVMELLQKLRAKEKTNSTVICSIFSKSNSLNTDNGMKGPLSQLLEKQEATSEEDFLNAFHDQF